MNEFNSNLVGFQQSDNGYVEKIIESKFSNQKDFPCEIVKFQSLEEVSEFIKIARSYDFDIDIRKPKMGVYLDAKSFLSVASMYGTVCEIVLHSNNTDKVRSFLIEIAEFLND